MTGRGMIRRRRRNHRAPIVFTVATRSSLDQRCRGGDMFEACGTADGTTWAILADVSSKGLVGMLHAEMIRDAFRRSVAAKESLPEILCALNRLRFDIPRRTQETTFASALVCVVSPATDFMTYASAGHDVALVVESKAHRHLEPTGPLLGVSPATEYRAQRVAFPVHALLVVATDGVTEARSALEATAHFGTTGLARVAHEQFTSADLDAGSFCRKLDAFCGGRYRDDATLAVIRRG